MAAMDRRFAVKKSSNYGELEKVDKYLWPEAESRNPLSGILGFVIP